MLGNMYTGWARSEETGELEEGEGDSEVVLRRVSPSSSVECE